MLIFAVVVAVGWWRSAPLAHGDAPALNGQLAGSGESFDLGGLRGQPALVHFWATWCPVCGLGNGTIDAIAEDYAVITVAMQSGGPNDIAGYMTNEGLSFPVIPDPHGELASRWGVRACPPASWSTARDASVSRPSATRPGSVSEAACGRRGTSTDDLRTRTRRHAACSRQRAEYNVEY
jgi:thiol-disulfide isomerase/thioredoxin